jgi:hypothetical protein
MLLSSSGIWELLLFWKEPWFLSQYSGKVKLSLVLNQVPRHALYGGVEVELRALTSALEGGEWSASRPDRFTPEGRKLLSIWQEVGWVPELIWTLWRREKSYPYWGYLLSGWEIFSPSEIFRITFATAPRVVFRYDQHRIWVMLLIPFTQRRCCFENL